MKVAKIRISNILGIEELEIRPGSVTEITGPNGSGKTSVLEAIRAALGGGHDATLIRQGTEKGQVVIELEDGVRITKEIRPKGSDLRLTHPTLGQVGRKQGYLNELVDALGINPVDFLTAPKKRRVEVLLEAMPLEVTAGQVSEALGEELAAVPEGHALEVLGNLAKSYYDHRTGVNRAAREKRATAAEMERNLPGGIGGEWEQVEAGLAEELRQLRARTQAALTQARDTQAERAREIEQAAADRIAAIKYQRDMDVAGALRDRDAELERIRAAYEPENQTLTEDLARAKAQAQAHRDAEKTREFIERQNAEAEQLEAEAERVTQVLGRLEGLKADLLANLPIQGVEIVDGDLLVDGIPFDRVNESRRIRLAMEIARLRAGDLGLVVVDGLERLDRTAYEAFKAEAAQSGLQFIVTRVSDEPELTVTREGAA